MKSLLAALVMLPLAVGVRDAPLADRRIDVNGTPMHIRCGGERRAGASLVLLEAGAFNTVDTWRDVQTPIASFARVCAHDRPGRGASGPPPDGLDARGYVALLRNLLKAGDEPPPYVFVGHSLGGLSAQLYASLHPSEIAGLVLVDSSHQDQIRRMAVLPQRTPPPAPPPLPPEAVSLQAFVDALAPLPWALDVPLVVLTRSRWTAGADTPDDAARLALWTELQRNLATRSQQSEHIIATNSGHYIQNDDPSLVIEAIRRMAGMR